MGQTVLEMIGIKKSFSGIYALSGIDFSLELGEVHALLGENGAGKSTLIKVLGGIYQPDSGIIKVNGKEVKINGVPAARENGIGIIHQEIVLVPYLSVAQNLFLGREIRTKLGTLREDLDDWARRNQAVVFYKGFSSAGIAALDYAGWFQRTWHTPFDGREAKTALIQKENGNLYTYTEGDTLFPGTYNYHILGEFDGNRSPTFQGDAFFYYPLADITDLQGLLFTNVDSGESLSELTSIVEKTGRSIEYQTYTDSNLNIFEVLKKMLMDDFVSRSLLFAFLGLVFCAVFAMSMMYRESNRFMVIHHLYGAAYAYLFVRLLLRLMCIAVLGTGLGYILGRTQLYLIHRAAYLNVALLSGVCNILFICVVQEICFLNWKRKHRGMEGRY